jgi:hypothetical protein
MDKTSPVTFHRLLTATAALRMQQCHDTGRHTLPFFIQHRIAVAVDLALELLRDLLG